MGKIPLMMPTIFEKEFNIDYFNDRFPIKKFFNAEIKDILINDLINKEQIIKLIAKRGKLSVPGLEGITFPFLQSEKESSADLLIPMLRFMMVKRRIPRIWKIGKSIVTYKGGGEDNSPNWRPMTLISVIYRIIFVRISQAIMDFENRPKRTILSMAQKRFVPRING
jgi:hypothetical protein